VELGGRGDGWAEGGRRGAQHLVAGVHESGFDDPVLVTVHVVLARAALAHDALHLVGRVAVPPEIDADNAFGADAELLTLVAGNHKRLHVEDGAHPIVAPPRVRVRQRHVHPLPRLGLKGSSRHLLQVVCLRLEVALLPPARPPAVSAPRRGPGAAGAIG